VAGTPAGEDVWSAELRMCQTIGASGPSMGPYTEKGFIDHQTPGFHAYLRFIEDVSLGGQRISPKIDGRPGSGPAVRENIPEIGDSRGAQRFD
jgi:hypothetical protein